MWSHSVESYAFSLDRDDHIRTGFLVSLPKGSSRENRKADENIIYSSIFLIAKNKPKASKAEKLVEYTTPHSRSTKA